MHPNEIRYNLDHFWIKNESRKQVRLGITRFLAMLLKKAIYVDLPEAGTVMIAGDPFGSIESSKAVSDLISPLSGKVVEINKQLADAPGLANTEPYDRGWLIVMKPDDPAEINALLTTDEYRAAINSSPAADSCQP